MSEPRRCPRRARCFLSLAACPARGACRLPWERAAASLRKCVTALGQWEGPGRGPARLGRQVSRDVAGSSRASRPGPSHNPARAPGLFLFRHLAAPVSRGSAAVSRLPSAGSRSHPSPVAASGRLPRARRVRLTGPANSELPASPLALCGALGAEGGGQHCCLWLRSPRTCRAGGEGGG